MFHFELNNFVVKFHQLWQAGFNAHLNVDSHAGHAWCGLRVDLGPAPGPQQHQVRPGGRRHAPSYRRRLDARAAARAAKEAEEATAAKTAEEAAEAKKAAEDAATAQRVTEAVIAVGTGVAATAMRIAEKAEAAKNAAEEATDTAVLDENVEETEPNFEFSVPIAEEGSSEKNETLAEEASDVKENEHIVRNEERFSVGAFLEGKVEIYPSSIMRVPSGYPAPEWFCDLLGTRQHHGNVKFLMTKELQTMLGHHADYVITHYQFVRRLWAYMSALPLNKDEFIPIDRCVPVFGSGVKKWSDIKKYLGEHVYFRSTRVGVFSGKKC